MATTLSTELLEHIFKHFTTPLETYWGRTLSTPEETFRDEDGYYEDIRHYRENRHQLSNLALVCKEFHAIAQPLLYTNVRLIREQFDESEEVELFVRTLAFNVNCRHLVHSLSLEFCVDEESPGQDIWAPEEWSFWRGYQLCLEAMGVEITLKDLERGEPSLVAHRPIPSDHWKEAKEGLTYSDDVAAILLYWLSKLTKLQIALVPVHEPESESSGIWRCKGLLECMRSPLNHLKQLTDGRLAFEDTDILARCIPAGLLSTTDLVMANPHERPFSVKAAYPPLMYCSFADIEPWWHLPALKSLALHRIAEAYSSFSTEYLTGIQTLGLYDCNTSPEQLSKILKFVPRLSSLRYSVTSPEKEDWDNVPLETPPFQSPAIIKTILQHCTVLGSLEFRSLAFQPFEHTISAFEHEEEEGEEEGDEEEELPDSNRARRARSYLTREIESAVDLRWNATLKRLSCHMVDLAGWTLKWSTGEAVDVHLARVLPRNLEYLKLRYDGLFGPDRDGFSETTFDHLRDLIQDCRKPTLLDQYDQWLPRLSTVVLDVVETWKHAESEIAGLQEAALTKDIRLLVVWHAEAVE